MADERPPSPEEQIAQEFPPERNVIGASRQEITRGEPGAAVGVPLRSPHGLPVLPEADSLAASESDFRRPLWRLVVGWVFLLFTFVLVNVIVNIVVIVLFQVNAAILVSIGTFILFVALDEDGSLSRAFGVQTRPNSSPVRSVLYFLTFGLVAFLFIRRPSTNVASAESAPANQPSEQANSLPQPPAPVTESKDVFREVAETIVFVVVLVLLLKTFIAEAFVIPTGSMATTLWGYQKFVTCPNCEFQFPVNASAEGDPTAESPKRITRCECPNCRFEIDCSNVPFHSGDRVLVFKGLYDTGLHKPQRHDVVVFKYPVEPQVRHTAMNYIKRLIGLPGETIAICQGQLYCTDQPRDVQRPEAYWGRSKYDQYNWGDDNEAVVKEAAQLWAAGKFQIIRKPPDLQLAMSRIVFNNDFQPKNTDQYPTRWTGADWQGDGPNPRTFTSDAKSGSHHWLRYRNILAAGKKPELITDFMGYNTSDVTASGTSWVGDLMLECEVEVKSAGAEGQFVVEVSRGADRFQARFDLGTGNCTLYRNDTPLTMPGEAGAVPATRPTALKSAGTHTVRLANFDERLTLWVNNDLPFGHGVDYPAPTLAGPTENDLEPVSVGVTDAVVTVGHLKLSRDTYYTPGAGNGGVALHGDDWSTPAQWQPLRTLSPRFHYVHPGHYFCLGDNSPASADSRSWGMVPDRLMLGRALVVYFPFYAPYWPINSPTNRVGLIR